MPAIDWRTPGLKPCRKAELRTHVATHTYICLLLFYHCVRILHGYIQTYMYNMYDIKQLNIFYWLCQHHWFLKSSHTHTYDMLYVTAS